VLPAAIPLADLHSGQQRLFWGRMWICVSVCEYLVIWCYKTTVREITDCSRICPANVYHIQWCIWYDLVGQTMPLYS
jgi:hypothetical protein